MYLPDTKKKIEFSEQSQISEERKFPYFGMKLTNMGKIFAKERKSEQFMIVWVELNALALSYILSLGNMTLMLIQSSGSWVTRLSHRITHIQFTTHTLQLSFLSYNMCKQALNQT